MELRILVLKAEKLSHFLRTGSKLFHSITVNDKKVFKMGFVLRRGMFWIFLVRCNMGLRIHIDDIHIEVVCYSRLYRKYKVFCTNANLEGTPNPILDIFFF